MTYHRQQFVQEIKLCLDVTIQRKEQICEVTSQFLEQIAQFGSHFIWCVISKQANYIMLNNLLICLKCIL